MKFRSSQKIFVAMFTAFLCGAGLSRAYAQALINETVTVHAVQKTDAKSHPANVEGTFTDAPDPSKDDDIDVDNVGVVFKGAGVCDVVDDQVMFENVLPPPSGVPVQVLVIGREGIGDVYWIQVQPNGGSGGPGPGSDPNLWADVKDYGDSDALVLQDLVSNRRASTYSEADQPSLDCDTNSSGNGDVKFWLSPDPLPTSSFSWTVTGSGVSDSGVFPDGDSFTHEETPLAPGSYTLVVSTTGADPSQQRTINFWVVGVSALNVANATQTNVIGSSNWAVIKGSSSGNVMITANLTHVDSTTEGELAWSGGDPIPGQPTQRSVSVANPTHVHVTATIGGASQSVDIWVIWATVTIDETPGAEPAGAPPFNTPGGVVVEDGTDNLGPVVYDGGNEGAGKVCVIGQLLPAGVHSVIAGGWTMPQERMARDLVDGAHSPTYWETTWQPDGPAAGYTDTQPDSNDCIYAVDGPNIGDSEGAVHTYQKAVNFYDEVCWNGTVCSDTTDTGCQWSYEAEWDGSASPVIQVNDLMHGWITLP